mmetsp:Transcript_48979/g.147531  ORF Transcript_48979/g.147531 Transcript_48979/m.147531 type:complete len:91 (+) Transcript_48979:41-313(+)
MSHFFLIAQACDKLSLGRISRQEVSAWFPGYALPPLAHEVIIFFGHFYSSCSATNYILYKIIERNENCLTHSMYARIIWWVSTYEVSWRC